MAGEAVTVKLLTIGDSGVGKSWLLLRWADPKVKLSKAQSMPTIGIDFKQKNVDIGGKRVKLQIWDTAGQERFRTITQSYYRKTEGVILVYDITNRQSFESLRGWIKQIQQQADPKVSKILVGNKCDLVHERAVTISEGEKLAREFNMPFIETSAMTSINVEEAFMNIATIVKDRLDSGVSVDGDGEDDDGDQAASSQKRKINLEDGANNKPERGGCNC